MRNNHDQRMRDALWRLTALRVEAAGGDGAPLPLFLRTPSVVCLWMAALLVVIGLLTLGRVRLPRITRGTAVVVRAAPNDTALFLLLPASAHTHMTQAQHAELDTGRDTLSLGVMALDSALLDVNAARKRYAEPSLVMQLGAPKVIARLARCNHERCLTLIPGTTYTATARTGTRTLASYALPGS